MKFARTLLLTLSVIALNTISPSALAKNYILATATTGGTYYPVGVAIATLTKVKLRPKADISMSAINSAGSGENIGLLANNEAQFAILQGLYGYYAEQGTGPLQSIGKQRNIRAVTMLWQNVEHFIISKKHAKTGSVADLQNMRGMKMALGKKNSGTLGSNNVLLAGLGIDISKDFDLFYGGYGPSADALQNGQIEGLNIPAGAPTGAITKLMAANAKGVRMLDVTDKQMVAMDGNRKLWTRYVIAAGTYPGQTRDVNTIAQPNFLAVNVDVPEEDVYKITKTIYENLPFLNSIHPTTKVMALEKAVAGLPVPLHPGAIKFYREKGIDIPARLLPDGMH